MGLHGPVLGEGKIGPPLDRTVIRHGTDTGLITIQSTFTSRSGTDWTRQCISNIYQKVLFIIQLNTNGYGLNSQETRLAERME
jgi:hypothetical protein